MSSCLGYLVAPPVPAAVLYPSGNWVGLQYSRAYCSYYSDRNFGCCAILDAQNQSKRAEARHAHLAQLLFATEFSHWWAIYRSDDKKNSPEIRPTRFKERAIKGPG